MSVKEAAPHQEKKDDFLLTRDSTDAYKRRRDTPRPNKLPPRTTHSCLDYLANFQNPPISTIALM